METDEVKQLARKAMLMGIGLGVVTKQKAEAIAKELLEKGKANEPEVKKFADDILAHAEKKQKEARAFAQKQVKDASAKAEALLKKVKKKYSAQLNQVQAKLKTKLKPKAKAKKKAKKR